MFGTSPNTKPHYKIHDSGVSRDLVLMQPNWDDRFLKIMKKERAKTLRMISSIPVPDKNVPGGTRIQFVGWNDPELNFLDNVPTDHLEGLSYHVNNSIDLSKLSGFGRLRFL